MKRLLASFVAVQLAAPVVLFAQTEAGRGALRPYVHVFVAYGIAWLAILLWVWRISRMMKRTGAPRRRSEEGTEGSSR